MKIKKGDQAVVISGKEKGKKGKVSSVIPSDNRVIIENVNVVSKHKKPRSAQDKGGIMKKPASIEVSNVMVICPTCGKATRVAHKVLEGQKVRVCKKCGASLDKEMTKAVKKDAKAVKATTSNTEKEVKDVKKAAPKSTAKKATTTKKAKEE